MINKTRDSVYYGKICTVIAGMCMLLIGGVSDSMGKDNKDAKNSDKTVTLDVEKIQIQETMSVEVELTEDEILDRILVDQSGSSDPALDHGMLHDWYGRFPEKSMVRNDFLEAGLLTAPPENYIYLYTIAKPGNLKGWQAEVINSKGKKVWTAGSKSRPPAQVLWDGYDQAGKWCAQIGEKYSFVLKANDRKTKKAVFTEESFICDSYIVDTDQGMRMRFTTDAVFDKRGMNLTDEGSNILKKICYKIKSVSGCTGMITLSSNNMSLAKVQMQKILSFARDNRVDLSAYTTKIARSRALEHFKIVIAKKK